MNNESIKSFIHSEEENKNEQLVLLSKNSDEFNSDYYRKTEELGLVNSGNFKRMTNVKEDLDKMSDILEVDNYIKNIKHSLENTEVISYNNMVKYAKDNSLLFGVAKSFTGKIPTEAIDEIMSFNFDRVKNFTTISTKNTIVNNKEYHGDPVIYIMSSPHNFNGTKGFVSNCEVIRSKYHKKLKNLKENISNNNFLLCPLKKLNKVYFVIIKNW